MHGPANSGSLTGISAISVGGYHSCLNDTGSAWCWGDNSYGQLGDTTTTQILSPSAVVHPTTTTLTGPTSTPKVGVATTHTATVSPVPTGGAVSFTVDGNATGCGPMALDPVTGTASCAITFTTAGDHQVSAGSSGSTYDEPSTSSLTQAVDKGTQTIDFAPPGYAEVGETLTPVATSTANLPVTLSLDASAAAVCSHDAGTGEVTFNAPGDCVVDADQPGDADYQGA